MTKQITTWDFETKDLVDATTKTTTSNIIAARFDIAHKNLLQKIEKMMVLMSDDFAKLNFQLCFKNNELQNGKPNKYYSLTYDGYMMVAMSIGGKEAMKWKEKFIKAFNDLNKENQELRTKLVQVTHNLAIKNRTQGALIGGITHPDLFNRWFDTNTGVKAYWVEKGYFNSEKNVFTCKGWMYILDNHKELNEAYKDFYTADKMMLKLMRSGNAPENNLS